MTTCACKSQGPFTTNASLGFHSNTTGMYIMGPLIFATPRLAGGMTAPGIAPQPPCPQKDPFM